jgi:hypothetical protein
MADFKSFDELVVYIKASEKRIDKSLQVCLKEIWLYLSEKIKSKYWVRQPWRPVWNSSTPLFKTWKLRSSVRYTQFNKNTEMIYTDDLLASLHEYWQYIKMTDKMRRFLFGVVFKDSPKKDWSWWGKPGYIYIPPRPIRRFILVQEWGNIQKIVEKYFKIFD